MQLKRRGRPARAMAALLLGVIHLTDWGFELQLVPPASRQNTKEGNNLMSLDFLNFNNTRDLVYRTAPHMNSLVFASLDTALHLDQIHEALAAPTWCEFSYLMPTDELERLIFERNNPEEEWLKDDLFTIPSPSGEVDLERLCPQFYDGDYPQWLQKQQELWLPMDVLKKWGRQDNTMLNGQFWFIEPKYEEDILTELRRRGFKVLKRGDLLFY